MWPVTFRSVLQREWDKRRARNPRYSLRAFGRLLGTDHATLSQILRGRRALTSRTVDRYAKRIGVDGTLYKIESELIARIRRARFRPDSRHIAGRIGVSVDDVNVVLQRLLRTNVIVMRSTREWEVIDE
jgi:transcriptional regulator with XRE-family HTH domain